MFNCLKFTNKCTYTSNLICRRELVYVKFPRLRPLVLWKGQQRKRGHLLLSFIGSQIPLHRQYNLHYNDESVSVSCKTYSQLTRSAHTLLSKRMISLTLSAGIYRNTDEKLWLLQPSIWVFFFPAFEAVSPDGYGKISTTYLFIKYLLLMMEQLISLDRSDTNHLIMQLQFCLELCVFKRLDDSGSVLCM